jgi:hypothetical protein
VYVLKRIHIILLLFIIGVASLPITPTPASASVAHPAPTLISPNYANPFITKDTTPTLIFKAASSYNIEILKGIQIIGAGEANGEHLVPISITTPLSDGLHALTYRSVNRETNEQSPATPISIIVESNSFDISDIVPMISSITTSTLSNLLDRVQPIQQQPQKVDSDYSWFDIETNSNADSILTVGVNDRAGYPISNLVESAFHLTINGASQAAHLHLDNQIAEGVYQLRLELPSPVYGVINLSVDDVFLATQPNLDPSSIVSILPQTHHVTVNGSFTLPPTVPATLFDGTTQEVNVNWGSSVVNTTHSGTFEFTGTVANYSSSVKLYLVVTSAEDYRIVLTWDQNPSDLDSHLFGSTPEGDFHLFYGNKIFSVTEATYGVMKTHAEMEQDVTTGYGPETTTIYIKNNLDSGSYRFGVKRYSGNNELSQSNAIVTLHKGSELLGTFIVPAGTTEQYWSVFQIVGGELIFDQEHHLDQLMPELDESFEAYINQVIGKIHRLSEQPTYTEIANIMAQVDYIKSVHSSIEDIESYIVNFDELTPFLQ